MTEENNGGWATVAATKPTKQNSGRANNVVLKKQKSNGSAPPQSGKPQRSVSSAASTSFRQQNGHQKRESKRSNSFTAPSRSVSHSTTTKVNSNHGQNQSIQRSQSNHSIGSPTKGKQGNGKHTPRRSQSNGNITKNEPHKQKRPSLNGNVQKSPSTRSKKQHSRSPTNGGTANDLITESSDTVIRWSAHALLDKRIIYTDAPTSIAWAPHDRCAWRDERSRLQRIEDDHKQFNDFQPLAVNEETRWKSKAMQKGLDQPPDNDKKSEAIIIAKLQAILNKLSWTNLEKLTMQFLESLGTTVEQHMIQTSLRLVARKASLEPHFGPLYARLSVKLAVIHKAFKKTLLSICQEQFDQLTNKSDVDKKELIGLSKFVGELYMQKLIKGSIMVRCCETLLQSESDEAKLEAASQLLTIVGRGLDEERPDGVESLWKRVETLTSSQSKVSRRIQFLFEAVLEIRDNKWVNIRHQHESATTIAEVHAQAAAEAKHGPVVATSALRRSRSSDGFASKRRKSPAATSTAGRSPLRRVRSEAPATGNKSSLQMALQAQPSKPTIPESTIEAKDPDEVAKLFASALREFFVHGDVKEVLLSVKEITGDDDACASAVVSSGILHVLEEKEHKVKLFMDVMDRCLDDGCISKTVLPDGLNRPLDLLRDIEIDAPLAPKFLATIVARWLPHTSLDEILEKCTDNFREEGRPADFFMQVLRIRGGEATSDEIGVVQRLLGGDADAVKAVLGLS